MAGNPYCSNCNYNLSGLTESSKCPECGRPLVEVLTRDAFDPRKLGWGKRYTSPIMVFGLPLVHIAVGPAEDSPKGIAKGIIAIGDQAYGLLALGGLAVGVVAAGGMACGVFGLGGCAIGLLAWGGCAIGGLSMGGGAIGCVAIGGGAVGLIALGGGVVGIYALGGGGYGKYMLTSYRRDQPAADLVQAWSWFFGQGSMTSSFTTPALWMALALLFLMVVIGMICGLAYVRHSDSGREGHPP